MTSPKSSLADLQRIPPEGEDDNLEDGLLPQNIDDLEDLRSVLLKELSCLNVDETQEQTSNQLEIAIVCTGYGNSDENTNDAVETNRILGNQNLHLSESSTEKCLIPVGKCEHHNEIQMEQTSLKVMPKHKIKIQGKKLGSGRSKGPIDVLRKTRKHNMKFGKKPGENHRLFHCPFSNSDKFSCPSCNRLQNKKQTLSLRKSSHRMKSNPTECANSSEWGSSSSDEDSKHSRIKPTHIPNQPQVLDIDITHAEDRETSEMQAGNESETNSLLALISDYCDVDNEGQKEQIGCQEIKDAEREFCEITTSTMIINQDKSLDEYSSGETTDALIRRIDIATKSLTDEQKAEALYLQLSDVNTSHSTVMAENDTSTGVLTSGGERDNDTKGIEKCSTKKEKKRRRAEEKCKELALMVLKAKESGEVTELTQPSYTNNDKYLQTTQNIDTEPKFLKTCPGKLVVCGDNEAPYLSDTNNNGKDFKNENVPSQPKLCDYETDSSTEESLVSVLVEKSEGQIYNNDLRRQSIVRNEQDGEDTRKVILLTPKKKPKEWVNQTTMDRPQPGNARHCDDQWRDQRIMPKADVGACCNPGEEVVDEMTDCTMDTTVTTAPVTEQSTVDSDQNEQGNDSLSELLQITSAQEQLCFVGEIMGKNDTFVDQDQQSETPSTTAQIDINTSVDSQFNDGSVMSVLRLGSSSVSGYEGCNVADDCMEQINPPLITNAHDTEGSIEQTLTVQLSNSNSVDEVVLQNSSRELKTSCRPQTSCSHPAPEGGFCTPASFSYQTWLDNYVSVKSLTSHTDICIHDTLLFEQQDSETMLEEHLRRSKSLVNWVDRAVTETFLTSKSKVALKEKQSRNVIFHEMWQTKMIHLKTGHLILKYQPLPPQLYVQKDATESEEIPVFWKLPTVQEVRRLELLASKEVHYKDAKYSTSLLHDLCSTREGQEFTADVMDQLLIYRINRERLAAKGMLLSCEAELFEYVKLMCCATKAALQYLLEHDQNKSDITEESSHSVLDSENVQTSSPTKDNHQQRVENVNSQESMHHEENLAVTLSDGTESHGTNSDHGAMTEAGSFEELQNFDVTPAAFFSDKDDSYFHSSFEDLKYQQTTVSPTPVFPFPSFPHLKYRKYPLSSSFTGLKCRDNTPMTVSRDQMAQTLKNIACREKEIMAKFKQLKANDMGFSEQQNLIHPNSSSSCGIQNKNVATIHSRNRAAGRVDAVQDRRKVEFAGSTASASIGHQGVNILNQGQLNELNVPNQGVNILNQGQLSEMNVHNQGVNILNQGQLSEMNVPNQGVNILNQGQHSEMNVPNQGVNILNQGQLSEMNVPNQGVNILNHGQLSEMNVPNPDAFGGVNVFNQGNSGNINFLNQNNNRNIHFPNQRDFRYINDLNRENFGNKNLFHQGNLTEMSLKHKENVDRNMMLTQHSDLNSKRGTLFNECNNIPMRADNVMNMISENPNHAYTFSGSVPGCSNQTFRGFQHEMDFNHNHSLGRSGAGNAASEKSKLSDVGSLVTRMVMERRIAHEEKAKRLRRFYEHHDEFYNYQDAEVTNRGCMNQPLPQIEKSQFRNHLEIGEIQKSNKLCEDFCNERNNGAVGITRVPEPNCADFNIVNMNRQFPLDQGIKVPPQPTWTTPVKTELGKRDLHQQNQTAKSMDICQTNVQEKQKTYIGNDIPNVEHECVSTSASSCAASNQLTDNMELVNKLEASNMSGQLLSKIKRMLQQQEQRMYETTGNIRTPHSDLTIEQGNVMSRDEPSFMPRVSNLAINRSIQNTCDMLPSSELRESEDDILNTTGRIVGKRSTVSGHPVKISLHGRQQHNSGPDNTSIHSRTNRKVLLKTPGVRVENQNALMNESYHSKQGFGGVPQDRPETSTTDMFYHTGITHHTSTENLQNKYHHSDI